MKPHKDQTQPHFTTAQLALIFWRISFIIILIPSLFFIMLACDSIRFDAHNYSRVIQELISDFYLGHLLERMRIHLIHPLLLITNLLAIVAFAIKWNGLSARKLLIAYAILQISIGIIILAPDVYTYYTILPYGDYHFKRVVTQSAYLLAAYAVVSIPLLLLVAIGIWMLIFKPHLTTDSTGRYLRCSSCRYDLRGTASEKCPECGASVMAKNKTQPISQ